MTMRVLLDQWQPDPVLSFDVLGVPAPQGSKNVWISWHPPFGVPFLGEHLKRMQASVRMRESSKKNGAWRDAVALASAGVMDGAEPWDEPVAVVLDFWMPRPTGTRAAVLWPIKYPDVDKLTRSTFDGLKAGGVVRDDSLIVAGSPTKRYVPHKRGGGGAAPTGCHIAVYLLGDLEECDLQWVPMVVPYDVAPTWAPDTRGAA